MTALETVQDDYSTVYKYHRPAEYCFDNRVDWTVDELEDALTHARCNGAEDATPIRLTGNSYNDIQITGISLSLPNRDMGRFLPRREEIRKLHRTVSKLQGWLSFTFVAIFVMMFITAYALI